MSSHIEKVEKKIKLFEQAIDIKKLEFHSKNIERIFLAIDTHSGASEISENALQITLNLAKRFQANVYIACIAPNLEELSISEKFVDKTQKRLQAENISVIGSCGIGHPSEHILGLSEEFKPSLIVMPIPYGERAEAFEVESLGATVDLIVRKSPFPVLLVRKPIFPPNEITTSILLLANSIKSVKAAEWALTLAKKDSDLKLLSIIEKKMVEKVKELVETFLDSEIDQDLLKLVHEKEVQNIITRIVGEAEKKAIRVVRVHSVGNRIKVVLEEAKKKHTMIIASTTISQGRVLDMEVEKLIRFSKIPILIIKA